MKVPVSQLQQEIRQSKPFRSNEDEALLCILRTADVMRRRHAEIIEPHGITLQQYNVLRILRGAGSEGLPTLDIADRLIEQTPGITRLLDKLEDRTLIRRVRCKADRRQVLCYITDKGLSVLSTLDPEVERWALDSMSALNKTELRTLISLLDRLRSR